jgi:hypothetical protein
MEYDARQFISVKGQKQLTSCIKGNNSKIPIEERSKHLESIKTVSTKVKKELRTADFNHLVRQAHSS